MKLSFGIIVLNGEPFIKYNLEALYPHAHEIIVVEGAVEKFAHAATSDGHSIDNTVKIIRNFPDPEKKIKLIQRDSFWPEKDEMSNAYMDVCTGDYIWQVDVDEFYKPEDIETVRQMLIDDPDITRIDFRSVGFWRNFDARLCGASYIFGADEFIRLFKFKPGYLYVTHRPPTLADERGNVFQHNKIITAIEMESRGVVQYHYSYVFPDYVAGKAYYYSRMGWGGGHQDGMEWFNKNWVKISNPLRVHIINYPPSWLEPFQGTHPQIINKMIREIQFKPDAELDDYLNCEADFFSKIGNELSRLIIGRKASVISGLKAFSQCVQLIILPFNRHRISADMTIIDTALRLWSGKL